MKIALMSDVHANPKAFKAALEDAKSQQVEKIICLGDIVGYGYNPTESIKLVRDNCDIILKGNHDAGVVGELPLRWYSDTAAKGIMRHTNQVNDQDKSWLKKLPYTYVSEKNHFVCSHGTYCNPSEFEYVNYSYVAQWELEFIMKNLGSQYKIQFTGHTHMSIVYDFFETLDDKTEKDKLEFISESEGIGNFRIKPKHRYSFNVGSVGYPRNELDSVYVVYDTDKKMVSYRRLPFDAEEYQTALGREGISIPHWLSRRVDYDKNEQ